MTEPFPSRSIGKTYTNCCYSDDCLILAGARFSFLCISSCSPPLFPLVLIKYCTRPASMDVSLLQSLWLMVEWLDGFMGPPFSSDFYRDSKFNEREMVSRAGRHSKKHLDWREKWSTAARHYIHLYNYILFDMTLECYNCLLDSQSNIYIYSVLVVSCLVYIEVTMMIIVLKRCLQFAQLPSITRLERSTSDDCLFKMMMIHNVFCLNVPNRFIHDDDISLLRDCILLNTKS